MTTSLKRCIYAHKIMLRYFIALNVKFSVTYDDAKLYIASKLRKTPHQLLCT